MTRLGAYLAALCLTALPATAETLRLGTSPDYRPFTFHGTNGQLQGFDISLGKALCQQLDAECTWVEDDFTNLLTGLEARRYDAVLAALAVTPERLQEVDFTNSYDDAQPRGIFVGIDKAFLDVEAMSIGVAAGTVHEQHLRNGNLAPRAYATTEAAYAALLSGEVDLVFGSPSELEPRVFRTSRAAQILGSEDISAGSAAIAVRKGDDALRNRLNQALASLRADGTLARLRKMGLAPGQDL
jgi:ABC-type amino acid transport substrate-binding protein